MTIWEFLAHELAAFKYPKGVRCSTRQHRDPLDEPLTDSGKEIGNVGYRAREAILAAVGIEDEQVGFHELIPFRARGLFCVRCVYHLDLGKKEHPLAMQTSSSGPATGI